MIRLCRRILPSALPGVPLACLLLWAAALAPSTHGATTWATNSLAEWTDAADWSGGAPGASDTAVIGSTNSGVAAKATATGHVASVGAQVDSVVLGQNRTDNNGPFHVYGTLNLAAAASLAIAHDLRVGYGYGGYAHGYVTMGAGSTLAVGGNVFIDTSTWALNGDAVTIGGDVNLGVTYQSQAARFTLDGGTLGVSNVVLNYYQSSTTPGHLVLTNGATLNITNDLKCSWGPVSQTSPYWSVGLDSGTHLNIGRDLYIGAKEFMLDPAKVAVTNRVYVGNYNNGSTTTVSQLGGTVTLTDVLLGDATLGGRSLYAVKGGGTLRLRRPASGAGTLFVGKQRVASGLQLGEAGQDGTLGLTGAGAGDYNLTVRYQNYAPCALHGRGSVGFAGALTNNGQVVADGFGADATLDLTGFTAVGNGIDNPTVGTNGWFAVSGGKLLLPSLAIPAGTVTTNWGEAGNDTTIDLVNSLRLAFSGVNGGAVAISIPATNRTDVGITNRACVGVWDIDGAGFDFGSGSVTLTVRYDYPQVSDKFLTEGDLKLWHHNGSTWDDVTASLDTANKRITSTALASLSLFAVSTEDPGGAFSGPTPPSTVYRASASGNWADGTWVDSASQLFPSAAPREVDTPVIGTGTGGVGLAVAAVTVTNAAAACSNLWLGTSDGTVAATGTLSLANGAALTVGQDMFIGKGTSGKARGILSMEAGTVLHVGRDLDVGQADLAFPADAVTVGRDLFLGKGGTAVGAASLTVSGAVFSVPGSIQIGKESPAALILDHDVDLLVTNDLLIGGGYIEQGGDLRVSTGSVVRTGRDLVFGRVPSGEYVFTPPAAPVVAGGRLVAGVYRDTTRVSQNGGTIRAAGLTVCPSSLAAVQYRLTNGALLELDRPASGATTGTVVAYPSVSTAGALLLGDAATAGAIAIGTNGTGAGLVGLTVRAYVGALAGENSTALLQGWGRVDLDGGLINNGRIVADGYGASRTLVMTNFSSVSQQEGVGNFGVWGWYQRDGTHAGWAAQNRGRLELPVLTNVAGSASVRWGDTRDDVTVVDSNELVNSILLECSGVTGGDLAIALLAADRSGIGVLATNRVIGVWDIDGSAFAFGGGTVRLTFRYDDQLAAAYGLTAADLKVWQYRDSRWRDVTSSVDPVNRLITSTPRTSFSLFAVATENPMPVHPSVLIILE